MFTTPPDAPVSLPALVLAAGLSSRMGSFKPLLPVADKPLLFHLLDALAASAAVGPVIVVTGHHAAALTAALAGRPVTTVYNPDFAAGEMLSSVKAGLAALPPAAPAFLLAFADQPAVAPATLRALVQHGHSQSPRPPVVLPTYLGKRGHPVVLSTALVPDIRALPPADTLRSVVHRHLARAALLPVDDPAVLEDLDTPADVARAQARWRNHSADGRPAP
jgi:molybdenum cofactor cytidylyltransferase